jgi:ADP-ribosylglycohydrolase
MSQSAASPAPDKVCPFIVGKWLLAGAVTASALSVLLDWSRRRACRRCQQQFGRGHRHTCGRGRSGQSAATERKAPVVPAPTSSPLAARQPLTAAQRKTDCAVGLILGCAVGDAKGIAYENLTAAQVTALRHTDRHAEQERSGRPYLKCVRHKFIPHDFEAGRFTDDTQLTRVRPARHRSPRAPVFLSPLSPLRRSRAPILIVRAGVWCVVQACMRALTDWADQSKTPPLTRLTAGELVTVPIGSAAAAAGAAAAAATATAVSPPAADVKGDVKADKSPSTSTAAAAAGAAAAASGSSTSSSTSSFVRVPAGLHSLMLLMGDEHVREWRESTIGWGGTAKAIARIAAATHSYADCGNASAQGNGVMMKIAAVAAFFARYRRPLSSVATAAATATMPVTTEAERSLVDWLCRMSHGSTSALVTAQVHYDFAATVLAEVLSEVDAAAGSGRMGSAAGASAFDGAAARQRLIERALDCALREEKRYAAEGLLLTRSPRPCGINR